MAQENRRLDSWKEIADYLGRDVRTAIRWEKEKGLPIHRAPGGKRTAVVAYRDEIDAWMLSARHPSPATNGVADSSGTAESSARPLAPANETGRGLPRRSFRLSLALSLILAPLLFVGVVLLLEHPSSSASTTRTERPLRFVRADYEASGPRGLVTGDFNGDGHADLAFTNGRGNSVDILLGDGHGVFSQRIVSHTSIPIAERLAAGDFNGDGRLDLAVTSYDGGQEIEILLGRGDGSLASHFRADVGGRSRWIAAGLLDSDDKVDLVVAASFTARVIVFIGRGDGTFRESGRYEAEQDVSALALVDVNRDGSTDVIATDYRMATSSSISVYLNDGTGALGKRESYATGRGPLGLAAADFNQDGQVDLVTANFPLEASVLLGQSPAKFREPATLVAGRGNGYVLAADLDRDGNLDLVVLSEHSNNGTVFFGDGHGGFERSDDFATGGYPDAGVVADFDQDQRLDLAIANIQGNSISVLLNRTSPAQSPGWLTRIASLRSR